MHWLPSFWCHTGKFVQQQPDNEIGWWYAWKEVVLATRLTKTVSTLFKPDRWETFWPDMYLEETWNNTIVIIRIEEESKNRSEKKLGCGSHTAWEHYGGLVRNSFTPIHPLQHFTPFNFRFSQSTSLQSLYNVKLKRRVFLINRSTATGVSDVLAVLNSRSWSKKGKFQKKTQIIKG